MRMDPFIEAEEAAGRSVKHRELTAYPSKHGFSPCEILFLKSSPYLDREVRTSNDTGQPQKRARALKRAGGEVSRDGM